MDTVGNSSSVPSKLPWNPRGSSLMPKQKELTEEQLILTMEKMNASLAMNPQAVTSVTSAWKVQHAATPEQLETFWTSAVASTAEDGGYLQKHAALVKLRVRQGVPSDLRGKVWIALAGLSDNEMADKGRTLETFAAMSSGVEKMIQRDIPRTFPSQEMFQEEGGPGQKSLFKVLKAYSIYDSECGYCQGLSFIVAPLLLQGLTDVEAFAVFVRLMEETSSSSSPYKRRAGALRSLFTPEMPGLHLLLHQHAELVRILLPSLHAKFQNLGIHATAYASPWFLTLFTYSFPLSFVIRILDLILSEGAVSVMLKVSIAVLKRNEPLLGLVDDFEGVLEMLKGFGTLLGAFKGDVEAVVEDLGQLDSVIDDDLLATFAKGYFAQKQIASTSNLEIQTLRTQVSALTAENTELQRENARLTTVLNTVATDHQKDLELLKEGFEGRLDSALDALERERKRALKMEADLDEARRVIKGLRSFNTVIGGASGAANGTAM